MVPERKTYHNRTTIILGAVRYLDTVYKQRYKYSGHASLSTSKGSAKKIWILKIERTGGNDKMFRNNCSHNPF